MPLDREQMAKIVEPCATTSDRIRALAAAGAPRAEIARFLGKRYQHVRNVLVDDAQRSGGYQLGRADLSGVREEAQRPYERRSSSDIEARGQGAYWLRVTDDGCLPLPVELAEALGATPGQRVFAQLRDGAVHLVSGEAAMNEARARIQSYLPGDGKGVERFLAWRREAWERDHQDGR